jgi:hypothetical protein
MTVILPTPSIYLKLQACTTTTSPNLLFSLGFSNTQKHTFKCKYTHSNANKFRRNPKKHCQGKK